MIVVVVDRFRLASMACRKIAVYIIHVLLVMCVMTGHYKV